MNRLFSCVTVAAALALATTASAQPAKPTSEDAATDAAIEQLRKDAAPTSTL